MSTALVALPVLVGLVVPSLGHFQYSPLEILRLSHPTTDIGE